MTEKNDTKQLIDRLEATRNLSRDEWIRLIQNRTAEMQTIYLNGHRPSAHAIMDAAYTSAD